MVKSKLKVDRQYLVSKIINNVELYTLEELNSYSDSEIKEIYNTLKFIISINEKNKKN